MTDCGRVEDWLNGTNFLKKEFRSVQEVRWYVSQYDTQSHTSDVFWECVDKHDFETEIKILLHRRKTGAQYRQLHRIDRASHHFSKLDLEPGAYSAIRSFLESYDE